MVMYSDSRFGLRPVVCHLLLALEPSETSVYGMGVQGHFFTTPQFGPGAMSSALSSPLLFLPVFSLSCAILIPVFTAAAELPPRDTLLTR